MFESETEHIGEGEGFEGISLTYCRLRGAESRAEPESLILILPGLTGCAEDPYINSMVSQFLRLGHEECVVYNYRLLSQRLKLSERNVDLVEDLKYTLAHLKRKFPRRAIYGVGHSYGANQLVNYLGTVKEDSLIDGGVSIANPYDMSVCCRAITGTIWTVMIAKILSSKLNQVKEVFLRYRDLKGFDIQRALAANSVPDFDRHFTIHLYHFDTIEDYYRSYSSS